jgi:hypothetical protein
VEAVLRPESLRIFPVNSEIFLRFPAGNDRKSLENIQKLPAGILLPRSIDFQSFPAGYGDFSPLSGGIRSFPEAGIIDLEYQTNPRSNSNVALGRI